MLKGNVDFSKGLIYKLCCKDPNIKEIYVGSTVNFRLRKRKHKDDCNIPTNKEYNYKKSKFIRDHGGWENWEMILIEYYSATDNLDLRKRERYWFDELNSNLNMKKPYISKEERNEYLNEKHKIYKKNNREKVLERQKRWRKNNPEHNKQYQLKNNEIINCECGSKIVKYKYKQHLKTKKHIKWFNNNS